MRRFPRARLICARSSSELIALMAARHTSSRRLGCDRRHGRGHQGRGDARYRLRRHGWCHPFAGTHPKWIEMEGGRIRRFHTFLTGEFFAVLSDHSLLGRLMQDQRTLPRKRPVSSGASPWRITRRPHPCRLRHRSDVLLGRMAAGQARSYLSGLLIGTEINGAAKSFGLPGNVTLIASGAKAAFYELALARHGALRLRARMGDDLLLGGLKRILAAVTGANLFIGAPLPSAGKKVREAGMRGRERRPSAGNRKSTKIEQRPSCRPSATFSRRGRRDATISIHRFIISLPSSRTPLAALVARCFCQPAKSWWCRRLSGVRRTDRRRPMGQRTNQLPRQRERGDDQQGGAA